jgi:hypothetical protein
MVSKAEQERGKISTIRRPLKHIIAAKVGLSVTLFMHCLFKLVLLVFL